MSQSPYGDWLNHPFQHLRNDPGFDGEVAYAIDDGPNDFRVVSAYPNRTYYRYVYRGEWTPFLGESVEPVLHRVRSVRGSAVSLNATLGVPNRAQGVSARLSTANGSAYYGVENASSNLSVDLRVADGTARLTGPGVAAVGENVSVPVGREDELVLQVFVSDTAGGFSYRLELPVRQKNGSVAALSPYREVCFIPDNCNGAAAYVEGSVPDDVRMETGLRANETDAGGTANSTARTDLHRQRGIGVAS